MFDQCDHLTTGVLTLAPWVHAPEHLAQLLGLDPASGGQLPAPLEDQQQTRLRGTLNTRR